MHYIAHIKQIKSCSEQNMLYAPLCYGYYPAPVERLILDSVSQHNTAVSG